MLLSIKIKTRHKIIISFVITPTNWYAIVILILLDTKIYETIEELSQVHTKQRKERELNKRPIYENGKGNGRQCTTSMSINDADDDIIVKELLDVQRATMNTTHQQTPVSNDVRLKGYGKVDDCSDKKKSSFSSSSCSGGITTACGPSLTKKKEHSKFISTNGSKGIKCLMYVS